MAYAVTSHLLFAPSWSTVSFCALIGACPSLSLRAPPASPPPHVDRGCDIGPTRSHATSRPTCSPPSSSTRTPASSTRRRRMPRAGQTCSRSCSWSTQPPSPRSSRVHASPTEHVDERWCTPPRPERGGAHGRGKVEERAGSFKQNTTTSPLAVVEEKVR
jgi:hypothetical protein